MRIKVVLIIILAVGIVSTSNLLIDNWELSPGQLENVTMACLECHSVELRYGSAVRMHNIHSTLNCSQCHDDSRARATTNSLHNYLEWVGIGIVTFILAAIVANFIIANRRTKVE